MGSLGKSRFSNRSSDDSSSAGSSHGRSNLHPLQVNKNPCNKSWGDRFEQVKDVNVPAPSEIVSRRPSRLTSKSERLLATRMNELSQLESPLLRELAHRLGEKLHIETPRCFKAFKHPYANLSVAERWEEIQGCNDWNGLIEDKFDPVLKGEILRYGEFAQATYDAFDRDKSSHHYGTCKYMKSNLLEQVGLHNRGYTIKYFLYATTNVSLYPNFLARSRSGDAEVKSQDGNEHSMECDEETANLIGTHSTENSEAHDEEDVIDDGPNVNCHCGENSKQCNWIGFVAVCTSAEEIARLGRRDILVAWRGSVTGFDWIADLMDYMSPAGFAPDQVSSSVRVEKGFLHLYKSKNEKSRYNQRKSARDQVRDAIKHLVAMHKQEGKLSITVTGHSLGSALATLCAYDIAECGYNLLSGKDKVYEDWHSGELGHDVHEDGHSRHPYLSALKDAASHLFGGHGEGENVKHHGIPKLSEKVIFGKDPKVNKFLKDRVPVTVYSFGGPRVGNRVFVERMGALGVAVLRVVNIHDRVRKVPGRVIHHVPKNLHQFVTFTHTYQHVGVKLKVDNEESEYLQKPAHIVRPHCLEGYLHLVDSYQGHGKPYAPTYRDIALVNKSADFLLPKYFIPPRWWQEENKGLVMNENGLWRLPGRDESIPETPRTPIPEEEVWDRNVHSAQEKSKAAMSHNSSEPLAANGGHICQC